MNTSQVQTELCQISPTPLPQAEAVLRIAEELGRVIGKYLADELAQKSRALPTDTPPEP
jgi:hypothetical protein